ncbi:MAG TPA: sigma 54-interacting transcriptional regulator [Terriglobales bacterium]|nr:sigma 54-interacting transcriptional regulator [Terriglobales bacterium]
MSNEPVILDLPGAQAVFRSESMKRLMLMVERVARHNAAVLIIGETGTGKELIARALHFHSLRGDQPWIDVNCGALPEHLVESELFGYEKGAFSGADSAKPGFFELANKGTLFLDEVGELEPKLQVKLLRVLDGVPYYRLGGTKKVAVDVRLIAATNRELDQAVREGRFRGDLYHRLSQFQLRVPPLRERKEDIVPLAEHFLKLNYADARLSPAAAAMLESYRWPGNVRELRNLMMRAGALCANGLVEPSDLPAEVEHGEVQMSVAAAASVPQKIGSVPQRVTTSSAGSSGGGLRDIKRQRILEALARHKGHQGLASEELGISRRTLSRQLKQMREQAQEQSSELGLLSQRQQNYFRSTLEGPVNIKTEEGREFTALCTNVSLGGMAIQGLPLEAQNAITLNLSFKVPGVEQPIFSEAEIAWCSRDGHAGIKFLKMDDASSGELKRWILQKQVEEGWTALK